MVYAHEQMELVACIPLSRLGAGTKASEPRARDPVLNWVEGPPVHDLRALGRIEVRYSDGQLAAGRPQRLFAMASPQSRCLLGNCGREAKRLTYARGAGGVT